MEHKSIQDQLNLFQKLTLSVIERIKNGDVSETLQTELYSVNNLAANIVNYVPRMTLEEFKKYSYIMLMLEEYMRNLSTSDGQH